MLFEILFIILIVLYLLWLHTRYQSVWKHIAKLPGPTAFPIVGNVLQVGFKPEDYCISLRLWMKEYNFELFRVYGGPQPYVFISNPKYMEHVLSSTTLTYKKDLYRFLYPWLGKGLLTANGQHWVKHRKMITPSFHFQILQDFLHIINESTDRFMNLLESYASQGQMFDFQKTVTRSTIDVICECAMGIKVNAVIGNASPIADALNEICFCIQERVFSVLKRSDLLFSFTSLYRTQETALKIMYREFSEIIAKRREILINLSNESTENDVEYKRPKMAFLDNLLTAEIDGKLLTFQEIFEEVSTFMFEGHDTTASAIGFTIFCLSRHAEIQEKAFQEQFRLFGNDTERNPTYQELQDMKYLGLVLKETLRLFPSVPFIARTTLTDTEIDVFRIPAGTTLVCAIIGVGTDERNFEDPFVFRPERFAADKRLKVNPFDYVPFSAGPRNCIGQKFAMMELKVTVSKMLRYFEILPAVDNLSSGIHDPSDSTDIFMNSYDPRLAALVTLKSVNGIYVRLKRRKV